jgi:hypothetical protein
MRNLVRVVVLDRLVFVPNYSFHFPVYPSVVDFLLFLGKLVIVLLTGVASYMTFSGQIPEIKVSSTFSSWFSHHFIRMTFQL